MKHQPAAPSWGKIFKLLVYLLQCVIFSCKDFFPSVFSWKFLYLLCCSFFSIPGWTNQPCVHRIYICSLYAHLGTLQPLSMSEVNVELLIQLLSLSIFFLIPLFCLWFLDYRILWCCSSFLCQFRIFPNSQCAPSNDSYALCNTLKNHIYSLLIHKMRLV